VSWNANYSKTQEHAVIIHYFLTTNRLLYKNLYLLGFKRSRLIYIHVATSAMQVVNTATVVAACAASVVAYTWQSSAYWCSFKPWAETTWLSSAVYREWRRIMFHSCTPVHDWMKTLLAEIINIKVNTNNNISNIKQYIYQRCYLLTKNIYGYPKSLHLT